MTSASGNSYHMNLCAAFEQTLPSIAFHSTIDVNTTAATSPTKNLHNDDSSTHSDKSAQTHPLLVTFYDQSDRLLSHPVLNDHTQEYMHWHHSLSCTECLYPTCYHNTFHLSYKDCMQRLCFCKNVQKTVETKPWKTFYQ